MSEMAQMLRRHTARGLLTIAVGVLCAAAAACGDSGTSPSDDANLVLMLEDRITDDVQQVNIYFTSVTAKPVDRPVERLDLELPTNPVNLLELDDTVVMLAAGAVSPGAYEFIRIEIDQSRSHVVENGVRKPLRVPSEQVRVLGGFSVDDEHRTTVTLDFDAEKSLVRLGNGDWLLQPVIVITGNNQSSR
jgi:hypothetical protein